MKETIKNRINISNILII